VSLTEIFDVVSVGQRCAHSFGAQTRRALQATAHASSMVACESIHIDTMFYVNQ